jgi:hypothetical protein
MKIFLKPYINKSTGINFFKFNLKNKNNQDNKNLEEFIFDFDPNNEKVNNINQSSQKSLKTHFKNNSNLINEIKVIDIKFYLCEKISNSIFKPDNIILYYSDNDVLILLKDYDFFIFSHQNNNNSNKNNSNTNPQNSGINSDIRSTNYTNLNQRSSCLSLNTLRKTINLASNKSINLFYKLNNEIQIVIIDIFRENIEKIILKLSINCSILMLKYILLKKLNLISESTFNFNVFGIGFVDCNNTKILNKKFTNKKFDDNVSIEDIIKYYSQGEDEVKNNEFKILNLILMEKRKSNCKLGLDFKFNIFKEYKKLDKFEQISETYRNVSDGINLFIYCLNNDCEFFQNYFVVNLGFGYYDIFNSLDNIKCPFCNKKEFNQLRNIGMINCKWVFKAFFKGNKNLKIEGDECTYEKNKLYILKEIDFNNIFKTLIIDAEFYINKNSLEHNKKNNLSLYFDNNNDNDDNNDEESLDSIYLEQKYLYEHEKNKNPFFITKEIKINNLNSNEQKKLNFIKKELLETKIQKDYCCTKCQINNSKCCIF